MHGGQVTVSSEGIGRGSKFQVRLPLLEASARTTEPGARSAVAPSRILVVDDNVDAANSVAMILGLDGHEVECAYTARAALDSLRRLTPDVAFLDIGLPEMNGFELARRIRATPGLAPVRLVALTGYGQDEDRKRAFDAGFDDHLVKPADLRALQEILARPPSEGRIKEPTANPTST
jgi:CheY-like chemotaxis protein